jgi:hypothetical protein
MKGGRRGHNGDNPMRGLQSQSELWFIWLKNEVELTITSIRIE